MHTIVTYARYCRATGLAADQVNALATSAIREAANRGEFLARAREAYLILNVSVAHWAAEKQADIFEHAFGRRLAVEERSGAGRPGGQDVGTDLD